MGMKMSKRLQAEDITLATVGAMVVLRTKAQAPVRRVLGFQLAHQQRCISATVPSPGEHHEVR
jgi:hypothetical protein